MRGKPAENTTISVAAIITATVAVLRAYGIDVKPELVGLLTLLVGATPHVVTWWTNRKSRAAAVAGPEAVDHG